MAGGVVVNGTHTHFPNVYVTPEFANLKGRSLGTGIVAYVGSFPFLEYGVPYLSTNQTAFEALSPRDPTLLKLSNIAWNPSDDPRTPGAPAGIYLLSVDTTTQAQAYLQTSTPANCVLLKSKVWGPRGNMTRATFTPNANGWTDVVVSNAGVTMDKFRVADDDAVVTLTYLNPNAEDVGADPDTAYGFAGAGIGTGSTGAVNVAKSGSDVTLTFSVALQAKHSDPAGLNVGWYPSGPVYGAVNYGTTAGAVVSAGDLVFLFEGISSTTGLTTWERCTRSIAQALAGTMAATATSWASVASVIIYTAASAVAGVSTVSAAAAGTAGTPGGTLATQGPKFTGSCFPTINATNGQTYASDIITLVNAYSAQGFTASTSSPLASTTLVASLDTKASTTIVGGTALSATAYRLVEAINSKSVLLEATQVLQAEANLGSGLTVNLAGGTVAAGIAADYTTVLTELSWYDVNTVVPMTSDAATHAIVKEHCSYMSGVGANERNAWYGASAGETYASLAAKVVAFNDFRSSFVIEEADIVQYNGATERMEPYWYAAMLAAMENGQRRTPLTHKKPRVQQVYRHSGIATREVLDACIQAGMVVTTAPPGEGLRVERWVTTHVADTDAARTEGAAVDSTFDCARAVRAGLKPLIGSAGTTASKGLIEACIMRVLTELENDGVIRSWVRGSITIAEYADRYDVRFTFSPAIPINFILVTPVVSVPVTSSAS